MTADLAAQSRWNADCAHGLVKGVRTETWDGVKLAEIMEIETGGERFRVPAGYLSPWPHRATRGHVDHPNNLAFAFWMPSKRYPECDRLGTPDFHPRESGRSPPNPGDYIVEVALVKFGASKIPGQLTPRKEFENNMSFGGPDAYAFRERFGLIEYRNMKQPNSPFVGYRDLGGEQPNVRIRCDKSAFQVPNPLCWGSVLFTDLDLQFLIRFSSRDVETSLASMEAARDLIVAWREVGSSR